MRKLKWILPVAIGVVVASLGARMAVAGSAAVVCASKDALPSSDGQTELVYFGDSTPGNILNERDARLVARQKCEQANCGRCEDVCSGEGSLLMTFSYKMFTDALVVGCDIVQAPQGGQLAVTNDEISGLVRLAASRCEDRLRRLGVANRSCSTRTDILHYHSDPSSLPFEAHYY